MFVRRSSVGFAPIFGSVVNVRELRALILSCPLFVLSPLELGGIITSCRTPATTLLYRLPWRSRRDLTFLFFSNTLRSLYNPNEADYLATRKNAPVLSHCVFDGLNWASPDNFPSWLGLEYCRFLCKRIDASTLFCGRFLDDNKFRESGHKEGSRFL